MMKQRMNISRSMILWMVGKNFVHQINCKMRTDEEWSEIFSQFFNVEEVTYFSWDGEDEETRRIFVMSKKVEYGN